MKTIKQKLISIVLAALMLMSALAATTSAASGTAQWYCDINEDAWYYDSVATALELMIMNGTLTGNGSNNLFEPEGQLTREQFVTIFMRTISHMPSYGVELLHEDWEDIYDYTSKFSDVKRVSWYGNALMWAENAEVTNGITESLFGIGRAITREEMATLIYRYMSRLNLIDIAEAENVPEGFADEAEVSEWAVEAVDYMRRTGIIMGDDNGNFRPGDTATRAEAAAIFVRLFNSAELDLAKVFDENNVEKIAFTTRDESQGGLLRKFTLEGDEAKDAVKYFGEATPTSKYSPLSVGVKSSFALYDGDGKHICSFNFTESTIFVNGYRIYDYEKDYFAEYYDRLYES